MGCARFVLLGVVIAIVYHLIKRAQMKSPNKSHGWQDTGPAIGMHHPPEGLSVMTRSKGQRTWVDIKVPLSSPMPEGLVAAARPTPNRPIPQDNPVRGFDAVFMGQGKNPEALALWATPEVQRYLMDAWLAIREAFWLRGQFVRTKFEVSGDKDPKVGTTVFALQQLARNLAATETSSHPIPSAPHTPQSDVPEPAPSLGAIIEGQTATTERTVPAAAAPPPPMSVPDEGVQDTVDAFFSWALPSGSTGARPQAEVLDKWKGTRLSGTGKVVFSSPVFGTDYDFGVSGGLKVQLEYKRPGGGVALPPSVVVHVADKPAGGRFPMGATVRYNGIVRSFNPSLRTLLLERGTVTVG